MRVCVVAEYYPRRRDPVQGAWAHRQAIAARDAGADVRVLALERPLPGAAAASAALRGRPGRAFGELRAAARQPGREVIDGIEVEYVRFVSPRRERAYARWHRWAARPLARALDRAHEREPIDVVHAHYALPAGGAALPWARRAGVPLLVSVHGGDLLGPLLAGAGAGAGARAGAGATRETGGPGRGPVSDVLRAAAGVVANSSTMRELAVELGAAREHTRVIHPPGEPPPDPLPAKRTEPTVATVGAVDPRKRHEDVLAALSHVPAVRWVVIGAGPERARLEARARERELADRIEWLGALPPREAIAELARCHVMAMPSVDEAFGVAYVEALTCGIPAIGCANEPGPEEIATVSPGMTLVPPRDPTALAAAIQAALEAPPPEPPAQFSLDTCGRLTLDAYEDARQ
jgi:glycosyltransferase involved in cell wall biosynthesis